MTTPHRVLRADRGDEEIEHADMHFDGSWHAYTDAADCYGEWTAMRQVAPEHVRQRVLGHAGAESGEAYHAAEDAETRRAQARTLRLVKTHALSRR